MVLRRYMPLCEECNKTVFASNRPCLSVCWTYLRYMCAAGEHNCASMVAHVQTGASDNGAVLYTGSWIIQKAPTEPWLDGIIWQRRRLLLDEKFWRFYHERHWPLCYCWLNCSNLSFSLYVQYLFIYLFISPI